MVLPGRTVRVAPFGDLRGASEGLYWSGLDSANHLVFREDLQALMKELNEYLGSNPPSRPQPVAESVREDASSERRRVRPPVR